MRGRVQVGSSASIASRTATAPATTALPVALTFRVSAGYDSSWATVMFRHEPVGGFAAEERRWPARRNGRRAVRSTAKRFARRQFYLQSSMHHLFLGGFLQEQGRHVASDILSPRRRFSATETRRVLFQRGAATESPFGGLGRPREDTLGRSRRHNWFTTNATLLDRTRASEILDWGLDALEVSLDGISKETYEHPHPRQFRRRDGEPHTRPGTEDDSAAIPTARFRTFHDVRGQQARTHSDDPSLVLVRSLTSRSE